MASTRKRTNATTQASLFMFSDRIVWASSGFSGGETVRPACALLIGAERKLAVTTRGKSWSTHALLVGPNVARALEADRAGFYSLTLDPAHPANRYLRDHVLAGRDVLDLGKAFNRTAQARVRAAVAGSANCAESMDTAEWLLAHFFKDAQSALPLDPRAAKLAAWLREHVPPRARMAQLSELCGLSAGRLTHLFSDELGVSIRSYLRWSKMFRAIELLGSHRTVTEVAATIGFSDAAHFTRVLRSYYSAAPSFIINRDLVRVHSCGTGSR